MNGQYGGQWHEPLHNGNGADTGKRPDLKERRTTVARSDVSYIVVIERHKSRCESIEGEIHLSDVYNNLNETNYFSLSSRLRSKHK